MKNVVHNINNTKESKTPIFLEVKTDNDEINIIVKQKRSTLELAKKIRETFLSIDPTHKLIVIDLSRIEDIGDSLCLTVLNIALVSRNNGIKCKIIIDRDNIGCIGSNNYTDRKRDLCFAQLIDIQNKC